MHQKKLGQLILKIITYFTVFAFLSFLKNIIKNYILNNHQFSYICFQEIFLTCMYSRPHKNLDLTGNNNKQNLLLFFSQPV